MKKILIASMLFAALAFWFSCKHEPILPDMPPTNSNNCDPDTAYFQRDVLPILISNCAVPGCHDAITHEEGVNLTTYEKVISTGEVEAGKPSKSEIYEVLFETGDKKMPPAPRSELTDNQKDVVKKWIEQGALNNNCQDAACDSTGVSFANQVMPIINNSCKGCHSGAAPLGGLKLTNYAEVRSSAASGALLGSVERLPGYFPMPKNGSKLDDCKLALIRNWILEGMTDN